MLTAAPKRSSSSRYVISNTVAILCLAKGLLFASHGTVPALWLRESPAKVKPDLFLLCAPKKARINLAKTLASKQMSTGINNYYWNTTWKTLMNQACPACSLSCLFTESCSFISLTKTRSRAISINDRKVEAKSFYLNLDRFYFSSSTLVLFPISTIISFYYAVQSIRSLTHYPWDPFCYFEVFSCGWSNFQGSSLIPFKSCCFSCCCRSFQWLIRKT